MPAPQRVLERVIRKTDVVDGCWISRYSIGSHGYAQIGWHEGGKVRATLCHRVVYAGLVAPIPDGMTVDHLCHVRKCVNPAHLRLLTNEENARDNGFATRTHCPHGHAYDEVNTRVNARGHRKCIECERARNGARSTAVAA